MRKVLFIVLLSFIFIKINLFGGELPLAYSVYYAENIIVAEVKNVSKVYNSNYDRIDFKINLKVLKVLLGKDISSDIEINEYTDVGGSVNSEVHYTNNELCILVLGYIKNRKIHINSLDDKEVSEIIKLIKWSRIRKFRVYSYNSKWFIYNHYLF